MRVSRLAILLKLPKLHWKSIKENCWRHNGLYVGLRLLQVRPWYEFSKATIFLLFSRGCNDFAVRKASFKTALFASVPVLQRNIRDAVGIPPSSLVVLIIDFAKVELHGLWKSLEMWINVFACSAMSVATLVSQ